ncbi:hypothetical protein OHV08_33785 [Streptomyces canus]|uniref:hypothetical protein n=1 Tax=Streptomyces canus TaxID=58343 RepID=UPI003254C0B3
MSTTGPTFAAETARHVLWHYGADGGYQPGSFTQKLMQAIDAADVVHKARLRGAYPELVDAMNLAANREDGIRQLQQGLGVTVAPLRCQCGDEDGPFTEDGQCEDCERRAAIGGAA